MKNKNRWFLWIFLLHSTLICSFAATYTLDGTKNALPSCGGNLNNWTISGTTYTCASNSITFGYGDVITSTGNYTLSVANGMTFNGNNSVGSSLYAINLYSQSGGITFYNSNNTVYGSITSDSNQITLYGATVYGNIRATVNTVYILNSTIVGNIYSGGGNGIITSNTNITATTITATNNTINITGGTISGALSTSGGNGVQLNYVIMTSGSITTQNVPVYISGSTIGSSTSPTNISSGNYVYILNSSTVYANITAPIWTNVQTIIKDFSSVIYGNCTPNTGEPCQQGLVVEYRFDECSWNGTAGEVLDSSANGRNATRYNSLSNSSSSPSVLCKYSNGASTPTGYLKPQTNFAIPSNWTLSTWIKFPLQQNNITTKYHVFGSIVGGGDLAYLVTNSSNNSIDWGVWNGSSSKEDTFASNLSGWHHIVLTKSGNSTTIYLDGTSVNTVSRGVSGTINYILSSQDNLNNQALSGGVDEFKIFGSVLSDSQIQAIYANEYAGKNFDGSTRSCPCAETLQTCFTDDFNRANLGSKWSIISTGTYPPNITDNKLLLTQKQQNISSGISLVGDFPSKNNLVEIEFEHNAYAGNGADGVAVVLSDANVTAVAGAYGGSLGYAQRTGTLGFAGGWLGFGLDEYGNFANDNEGRGNTCSSHPSTSAILDSVTIRGKQGTDRSKGYCFIANSGNLQTSTGVGIDNTASTTPAPSNKYKFTIDTRSGTIITVRRDINDGNGYKILPNMNGVDATQVATAPDNFKLSFTGSTGDNYNFHSFDNVTIKALNCGTLGQEPILSTFFDAWETSILGAPPVNISRKIYTKIANQPFTLKAASIDNAQYQNYTTGLVGWRLVDNAQCPSGTTALTSWQDLNLSSVNPTTITTTIPGAYKNVRVQFGKKSGSSYTDLNCSSDNFAIRPNNFNSTITANQTFIADKNTSITFQANQYGGTGATNYNETANTSFKVDVDISDSTKTCTVNSIQFSPTIGFTNGVTSSSQYSLPNVGDYTVSIHEIPGAEFALVDLADTPDAQRYITPYSQTITVVPSTFLITGAFSNGSNGFTYLSNFEQFTTSPNRDISAPLDLNISARSATNALLSNYTALCYAKDANLTLSTNTIGTTLTNLSKFLWYEKKHDLNGTVTLANSSSYRIPLSKALFDSTTRGMAETNYLINFDRNSTKPVQPFRFTIQNLTTNDADLASGAVTLNQNATFYYGRVYSTDYRETSPIPATIRYEVYCANCNATGFNAIGMQSPLSISWYQNPLHTNTTFGNVSQFGKIGTTTIANPNTSTINAQGFDTSHPLTNATAPYVDRILMTPSAWLIFNPFNANATTNDFNVEFTRAGNWSGAGNVDRNDTSHTTGAFTNDTNITRSNRKMNW
ncbi:LamG-like jellyroll fold domain-containing protein [Sulfurospirillum sp.]|uniref:LamG-like jellyroll fold domain-containing protein n=1 Tax=Sulfurospirillum sp. TaxID=2053622 RepID=UPI002FDCB535